jgi:hemoglobin/transferrin/lactoferrin receptor protein
MKRLADRQTILTSAIALAAAMIAAPAMAQDAGGEPDADADEIVVVGALTDVDVDREELDRIQATDLRDIFRKVPSVSVGGSVGIAQKVYVRGLEDSQLNVTIDGAPQHGTLFHHIGRVSIEPELLETVELQAGAGEATAGFGAIGGAIRFRTRNPVDLLQDGRDFGAMGKASWFSNDGYKFSGTGYGRLFGDVGILGSYVYSKSEGFSDANGSELAGTTGEQQLGFVKLGGEVAAGHRFSLSYEHREEEGEFGARPNWPVLAGDTLYPAEAKRQTVVGNYEYDSGGVLGFEATGYWTKAHFEVDRFDRWGRYGADIESTGFDVRMRASGAGHRAVLGVEHRADTVTAQYLDDPSMWQPWAWDPNIGLAQEEGSLWGIYFQDHWRVIDPLLLSFGVRYDSYELDLVTYGGNRDSDGLSFNFGAELEVAPGLTFNAGYAEAFRGKEIGDGFTLEQNPGSTFIQPDLAPEQVGNFEIGAKYERGGFFASAVYFDMTIEDVIQDQLYGGTYYENVGEFTSNGVELRGGYATGPFSISGYYNHYDSRLNGRRINGYEQISLGNTMGDNWNVTAGYEPSRSLGFEASMTRFEPVEDLEVLYRDVDFGYLPNTYFIDKPGYTVVDLFAWWKPLASENVTLYAAVYNLFDEDYIAHASVGDYTSIPGYGIVSGVREPGRNFRLTAAFRF